jgi:pSer/pThr/pTyr-binding forkhead associated (FHA) protein
MNNQNYPLASLDNKKTSVPIFGLPAVLGRNENTVDMYFFHESVSREHCIFEFLNNRLTIRDLGSTAGTFVNGVRLNPDMPYYIDDGDKVKIGKVKFIFHANYQALSAMVQEMMNASVMAEPTPETSDFSEPVYQEADGPKRIVIEAVELNDYEYDESEVEFIDIGLEPADKPRSYTNQIKKAEIEAALAESAEEEIEAAEAVEAVEAVEEGDEVKEVEEAKETQTVDSEEMDDAIAVADEEALSAVSDEEGAALQLKWIDEESGDPMRVSIDHFPFSIGRKSDENDYAIKRKGISRKHMHFEEENGDYYIFDDESTNGVKLNGEKLTAGEKVKLKDGDKVRAGGITFAVTIKE